MSRYRLEEPLFRLLSALGVAGLLATFALVSPRGGTPSAYACSGAWPPLEDVAARAQAIAIVRALEVGGPDYTIPPLTPTATPTGTESATSTGTVTAASTSTPGVSATPTIASTPRTRPQSSNDITGIGARMLVERTILGSLSTEIEVDKAARIVTETELRKLELTPNLTSCMPGFLVPRYEVGKTYLMFLRFDGGAWNNTPPMFEVRDGMVIADWGEVSVAAWDAFLAGPGNEFRPVLEDGLPFPPERPMGTILHLEVPVATFIDAIRFARGEIKAPTRAPEPTATPRSNATTGTISPPDTGDAGLR